MKIYDVTVCGLGEGPLWHPERRQLFWFNITGKRLLTRSGEQAQSWAFDEFVSAAGWVDQQTLLIASETRLFTFDLVLGDSTPIHDLEADNPHTRSNDGRADPWGGFWIGTMGKSGEDKAGAIYRYYRGDLRRLHDEITVPNAICFTPDASHAYFADTRQRCIWRQPLARADGWPAGEPTVFVDLQAEGLKPDGAVVDTEGRLWNAQWGAGQIACYDPAGRFLHATPCPASQVTCPAFGGEDLTTLFATSATQNLSPTELSAEPHAGKTFTINVEARGQREHQVIL